MRLVTLVVATDLNGCIGKGNAIPWRMPADMKRFKTLTTGHAVIMGRKTYESIGKPLPNRANIVMTRDTAFKPEGVEVAKNTLQAFLLAGKAYPNSEIMVIGGAEIYREMACFATRVVLTTIDTKVEGGDAFFPFDELLDLGLSRSAEETFDPDEKNPFRCTIREYIDEDTLGSYTRAPWV